MRQLAPRELKDYLDRAQVSPLLLDVREPWEYAIAHIEGSELVPMRDIPAALHRLEPSRECVVICHHGIRSFQVACHLERAGFSKVINLRGGIDAWARQVDPTMNLY